MACLVLTALAVQARPSSSPAEDQGGIVKWVDEKGVTHYGDSIPPEYANRSNTLLNKSGRVLRKNDPVTPEPTSTAPKVDEEEAKRMAEQQRRDSVLLASYTTEQEIDLAKDRSTQMDEAAIKGLEQRAVGVNERLAMYQKSATNFQARKKPVPDDLKQDISGAKGELTDINTQIAAKRKNIDDTKTRFDRDKQRFHELKLGGSKVPPPN
jgi:hypothetical protein